MTRIKEWRSGPVPLTAIHVGDRVRQDLGDLESLIESIKTVGLLAPVVVDGQGNLIDGARRLESVRRIGWESIDAKVCPDLNSAAKRLLGERDGNTCRLPFSPSEVVALGKKLEELEKPKATARQSMSRKLSGTSDNGAKGDTRDKVAAAASDGRMSGRTYDKAKQVVAAAETGDPEAVEAKNEMDATGKVDPAFKKVSGGGSTGEVAEHDNVEPPPADLPDAPVEVPPPSSPDPESRRPRGKLLPAHPSASPAVRPPELDHGYQLLLKAVGILTKTPPTDAAQHLSEHEHKRLSSRFGELTEWYRPYLESRRGK